MEITPTETTLLGIFVPILVQIVRKNLLPWSGKAALLLSLLVAGIVSGLSYLGTDATPTLAEWSGNFAKLFTLSQVAYRLAEARLKGEESGENPAN